MGGQVLMKQLATYINEKLHLTSKYSYTCQPKNKDELKQIIIDRIKTHGMECNLNDIDVSKITDMSNLFDAYKDYSNNIFRDFNGDVSLWNVSNVENMRCMFWGCKKFNCDLSYWDVHNVKDMIGMFCDCEKFNQDLNSWDVSNVTNMLDMFKNCRRFNQDLNSWNVSNVENMRGMFYDCVRFNGNISTWDMSHVKDIRNMFSYCKLLDIDMLNKWNINVNNIPKLEMMSNIFSNIDVDKFPKWLIKFYETHTITDNNTINGLKKYNSNNEKTIFFTIYEMIDKYGPITKKEALRKLGLKETSYTQMFAKYCKQGVFHIDSKYKIHIVK